MQNQKKKPFTRRENTPFNNNPDLHKLQTSKEQRNFFETQIDLMANMNESKLKSKSTSDGIFRWLNVITYRKNIRNNEYLVNFKKWLLKQDKRSKKQIWNALKRVYGKFTVHGQKTKTGFVKKADIDAASSLLLLEMSWFKDRWYDNVTFVDNWQSWPGMNIDTSDGGIWWLKVDLKKNQHTDKEWKASEHQSFFNSILSLDEHGWWPSSSTRMIFEILKDFQKIPPKQMWQVSRFVQFVDIVDDLWYQASGIVSEYLERTIFGLHKFLSAEFIFNYFSNPNRTWFEYLSDEFLEKTGFRNFETKKYQTLKETSKQKKDRMKDGNNQLMDLEKKGYYLMYGWHRFIVDLWAKIIDGPETASINQCGIIRIFPESGDVYIYSPFKLPTKIGWFDVISDHFVIDKIWSGKDLNKLLGEFSRQKDRLILWEELSIEDNDPRYEEIKNIFEESKKKQIEEIRKSKWKIEWEQLDMAIEKDTKSVIYIKNQWEAAYVKINDCFILSWSQKDLNKEIIEYRKSIKFKNENKKAQSSNIDIWLKAKIGELPEWKIEDIEVWKKYVWIVNNKYPNMIFVTLDKSNEIRWILHKNKLDKEVFSSIQTWDKLSVVVKEKQGGKIEFVLDGVIKENQKEESKVA